ncbi:MAG TPA: uroporphyrinogen-III synthase [Mycobacteriales bacterium]|nr:uroporphyrinogen-III synthase [Mycobacteriales bacterium]
MTDSVNERSGQEPLTGFTVAVTAARRRDELAALLERRGASVLLAPAIALVPLADDTQLRQATEGCIADRLDVVVATTGIGFRGWIEAAEGWGLAETLMAQLGRAELLARGPKARGAVRASGLIEAWSPASESSSEVLEHLLVRDLTGLRIAVQLHGEPLPDMVEALRTAGASVIEVPVYRWVPPDDLEPLRRLVTLIAANQVDAVAFTSAPAAASLVEQAKDLGLLDAVVTAFQRNVTAACVGPVTAAPLRRARIGCVIPARFRLGALAREIVTALSDRRDQRLPVAGRWLQVRGGTVVVDDTLITLNPGPLTVLRQLAEEPGRVYSRAELLSASLEENANHHAVEVAVARIRTALGDQRLVQTVVKRGYRLAYEPERLGS